MPRFFVSQNDIVGDIVKIVGDDSRHIARSLRMAVGEKLTVCDTDGNVYSCILERISDGESLARIAEKTVGDSEMPYRTVLYQALPKGDKMDTIVQKAVELGAYAVVPFISERCISRPDFDSAKKKVARWQRIAAEAAKQCGRAIIPEVKMPIGFREMLSSASSAQIPLFCYEASGTAPIKEIFSAKRENLIKEHMTGKTDISLVVGSEGGFSDGEAMAAESEGLLLCGLGRRILRCESASGYALACVSYEFEL